MKNYRQRGDAVYMTAASPGWASGDLIVQSGIIGVAGFDTPTNAVGVLHRVGIFSFPKATGSNWTIGQTIWYDTVLKKMGTATLASAALVGIAVPTAPTYTAAALSADLFGDVLLTGK